MLDSLVGEGTILKVLLGGAVAYSFKDVLAYITGKDSSDSTTKERISVVTVGLVSAVSGYALGYWSMVASTPKCNSLGILTLLDKPIEWNRFEREVWQRSMSKASLELSSTLRRIKINRPDIMNLEELNDPLLHQIRQKITDFSVSSSRLPSMRVCA